MAGFFDFDKLLDVSGGSAGGGSGTTTGDTATMPVAPSFEQLITDEGGLLAVAYGEHIVAGHLIAHKYEPGPPPSSKLIVAGGEGEWDSVVTCWYAAEEIASSPDGTTAGYHFYPGTIPVSTTDPTQPVDSFLSSGLAYNSTAYLAVLLPEKFATEDRPDKLKWRPKCKKVYTYDVNGTPSTATVYSVNPADVAVDRIRKYYEDRYDDQTVALRRFRDRVDWQSYKDFRDYCAATISWEDGTTTRTIPRFECHVAFTSDVNLGDALGVICSTAATWWQDDGQRIRFIPPNNTTIEHHFDESNIVSGSFSITPRDMRDRPNYLLAEFRDLDDPYLAPTKTPPAYRQDLIDRVGRVRPANRVFPNMYRSQAERLLQRQLRLEADNPNIVNLRGMGDSFHVLPGDYVTVSHSLTGWTYQKCLVLEANADSAEKAADEVDFTLQAITSPSLYLDTDHTKKQAEVAP